MEVGKGLVTEYAYDVDKNVNITAMYSGDSMRPTAFIVSYSVNGELPISTPLGKCKFLV